MALSINLMDRVLGHLPMQARRLQLLGAACLLVASKFEEVQLRACDDFAYMTGDAFTVQQIVQMESVVLSQLGFSCSIVSPFTFLNKLQEVDSYVRELHHEGSAG